MAPHPPNLAFEHSTWLALPHGVLSAVHLPGTGDPVPELILGRLFPPEREAALALRGFRQEQFVGGRLALHDALHRLKARHGPLLSGPGGEVQSPPGVAASVSHKRDLAIALVAFAPHATLGVDLEDLEPARPQIAERVLTPAELAVVDRLPPPRRWMAILLHFSIKECIYKALYPRVRRFVDFQEANLRLHSDGTATVNLELTQGEGPFGVDARYFFLGDRVVTSTRIRPLRRGRGREGADPREPQEPEDRD